MAKRERTDMKPHREKIHVRLIKGKRIIFWRGMRMLEPNPVLLKSVRGKIKTQIKI